MKKKYLRFVPVEREPEGNPIGKAIKKRREALGITQTEMAKGLDLTQPNYGRLEKDDNRISIPKFIKVCELLDIEPGKFLDQQLNK